MSWWLLYPKDDVNEPDDINVKFDSNEDFICGYCMKEIGKRYLFCSKQCSDTYDKESDFDDEWVSDYS